MTVERIPLTERQREAVQHDGNVVVSAGPGSGKTLTLVARALWALDRVSTFRGIACLTYTTDAAREITGRLAQSRAQSGHRASSSTLHSFCLNQILRPYGPLHGEWVPSGSGQVIDDATSELFLQRCLDNEGVAESAAWRQPAITKIRRALVCGESVGSFDAREVAAAIQYDRMLIEHEVIDFEAMVHRALALVRRSARLRDVLHSRFPHILVDEYQDMGGPLHQLVLLLYEQAGSTIFAVGDTDQTMFGFAGADARYLEELIGRKTDFRHVELDTNFRSGHDIVAVADALLAPTNPRQAAQDSVSGSVEFYHLNGGFDAHAIKALEIVKEYRNSVPLEEIAILYPQRGFLLDRLIARLTEASIPFVHEKSDLLPIGDLSRFVQRVTSLSVAMATIRIRKLGPEFLKQQRIPTFLDLVHSYNRLRRESGCGKLSSRFEAGRRIGRLVDLDSLDDPDSDATSWLKRVYEVLQLEEVAAKHPERVNRECLAQLSSAAARYRLAVRDLASQVTVFGKIILTTYHSSKGREFDSVILPGLVNGLVPRDVKDNGRWRAPNALEELEQRRSFYVALTRPENQLSLISGQIYQPNANYEFRKGPSKFLVELYRRYQQRLQS